MISVGYIGFMTNDEIHEKLLEQSEQIDLIGTELRWMLEECQRQNIQPKTPLGEEMLQKFLSLYRDFQTVKTNTIGLYETIHAMKFSDPTIGMIYLATAILLVRRQSYGIFEQFTSVVEHGCLPDGTSLDDLSS